MQAALLEFGILGPTRVLRDGEEIALGGARRRALLTRMLLDVNRGIPSERLIDDLWEGAPPPAATATLHSHISALRKAVGADHLVTRADGYAIVAADGALDAATFTAEVATGRALLAQGDPAATVATIEAGLARWRGPALHDGGGAEWATAAAARLDELRIVAEECLLEAKGALGAAADVVARAEVLVAEHPLRETLWGHLMLGLYRTGRQAEALRAYQRVRGLLAEQLGIDPGAELRALETRILAQDPALDLGPPATVPTPVAPTPGPSAPPLPTGVVTLLLTDVVGSTALWDRSPAAMAEALATHDAIVAEAVAGHGGHLLKPRGEGDSTFSVFQRATDAVLASVAAQRAIGARAWPAEATIAVRMALHTGEAYERDGDYYGPTVNRAARLRGVAGAGQVLLSRATADVVVDHLPGDVALAPLGPRQLRDLSRHESVYAVVGDGLAAAVAIGSSEGLAPVLPSALVPDPAAPFVGREAERASLRAHLAAVRNGAVRLVVLAGEPGIGKTRLAAEVATEAQSSGALVVYGRCDEELALPYQPYLEVLEQVAANLPPAVLDDHLTRRGGVLAGLLPRLAGDRSTEPSAAAPEDQRYLLYGAVTDLLVDGTGDRPVVVVLDDLQWADAPTLLLTRFLVTSQAHHLLVLATMRPSEADSAGGPSTLVEVVHRVPGNARITLDGLGEDEVRGLAGTDHELAARVHAETDGNPFFAIELLRHLRETGATASGAAAEVPAGVRDVVGARAARLGEECRRVLAMAAIVGREFDTDLVAAALETDPDAVLDALETSVAASLTTVAGPERFAFSHALVQQAMYETLSPARRARAHHQVAVALEAIDAGQPTRAGEIAGHWRRALTADWPKAVTASIQAGHRALEQLAPDEAVRWFGEALALLERPDIGADDGLLGEILLGLGEAQRQCGHPGYRATLLRAARWAMERRDTTTLVKAALANNRGFSSATNEIDAERIDVIEAALAALGADDPTARARLLALLAVELVFTVDPDLSRRRELSDEAQALARAAGDSATLLHVLNLRIPTLYDLDTFEDRQATAAEAVALADELGDTVARFWASFFGGIAAVEAGDGDEVDRRSALVAELADTVGRPLLRWTAALTMAWVAALHGDLATSEAHAKTVLRLGGETGQPDAVAIGFGLLAELAWIRGETAELATQYGSLHDPASTDQHFIAAPLAETLVAVGEHDRARAILAAAFASRFETVRRDTSRLAVLHLYSETAAALGERDAVDVLYDLLLPARGQVGFHGYGVNGSTELPLGLLALAQGRPDVADDHFATAEAVHRRLRAPFHLARTLVARGGALVARGDDADRQRGVAMLEEAEALAANGGFAAILRQARARRDPLAARRKVVARSAADDGPVDGPGGDR